MATVTGTPAKLGKQKQKKQKQPKPAPVAFSYEEYATQSTIRSDEQKCYLLTKPKKK
jgi:hypothetical protein